MIGKCSSCAADIECRGDRQCVVPAGCLEAHPGLQVVGRTHPMDGRALLRALSDASDNTGGPGGTSGFSARTVVTGWLRGIGNPAALSHGRIVVPFPRDAHLASPPASTAIGVQYSWCDGYRALKQTCCRRLIESALSGFRCRLRGYRLSSRVMSSMPLTVSGYIRPSIKSLIMLIDRTCPQLCLGVGFSQAA